MEINKILKMLRDPLWLSIAALFSTLVAILGAIITYNESMPNRLSIAFDPPFTEFSNFIPQSKIKFNFNIEGESIELDNIFFSYLIIQNNSSSSIKREDFQEKLGIKSNKKNLEIILVSSCKNLEYFNRQGNVNAPSLVWSKNSSIWEIEPELMNTGESGCSLIIVKTNSTAPITMTDFSWSGRVIGYKIEPYNSARELYKDNRKLSDYMSMFVYMETLGIFAFLAIQSILSLILFLLINKIWFLNKFSIWELTKFSFIFLIITATSQILAAIFLSSLEIHPIAWLILILSFLIMSNLIYKAYYTRFQERDYPED